MRRGGTGPPVLLLHGHPQTHVMWHAVAARLAEKFTVVAADLRGYGESSKPPTTEDHEPYSKRAMARDMLELMRQLGFDRVWRGWADEVGGRAIDCGHFLAGERPDEVADELSSFFGGRDRR